MPSSDSRLKRGALPLLWNLPLPFLSKRVPLSGRAPLSECAGLSYPADLSNPVGLPALAGFELDGLEYAGLSALAGLELESSNLDGLSENEDFLPEYGFAEPPSWNGLEGL